VEPRRLIVVVDGAIVFAFLPQDVTALYIGIAIFRIEPNGFAIVGNGTIEVPPVGPGPSPVVIGCDIFRIDAYCLAVIGDGAVKIALLDPNQAATNEKVSEVGVNGDRLIAIL